MPPAETAAAAQAAAFARAEGTQTEGVPHYGGGGGATFEVGGGFQYASTLPASVQHDYWFAVRHRTAVMVC
jgi:hypothetical protein